MPRPRPIQWPDNAKICVTFIIPWEVWPDNYATRGSLQRVSHPLPPENAVFKQNMAAVTEREYGDRVGIWRIMDMFARHNLKVTFLMNGKKVEQFPDEVKEFQAQGHEFSSECYEHEYAFMYTREEERKSIQDTVAAFKNVLGAPPTGYLSPGHASTGQHPGPGGGSGFRVVGGSLSTRISPIPSRPAAGRSRWCPTTCRVATTTPLTAADARPGTCSRS